MTEPCDLSAMEARRLIGARKLSPVELLESCLARTEAVNPALNALVTIDLEGAFETALAAEAAVVAGAPLGALHGLPVVAKDSEMVAGMRATSGAMVFRDRVAEEDDPATARIRDAGAVIFAKTNLPEFGTGGNTRNRLFGATGNPFAPEKTCGGSSGGAAVAVATGMAPLATGSDYGGSLRTPAGFCGITGIRPAIGTVPAVAADTVLGPWSVRGPMARSLADAHLLLTAQAGHDLDDPWSLAEPVPAYCEADLASLRVAASADLGCCPVSAEVSAVFRTAMDTLAPRVAWFEDAAPEFGAEVHDVFEITRAVAYAAGMRELVDTRRDELDPNVIDNVERGAAYSLYDVAWAQAEQAKMYRRFNAFFEDVDVLICPAASVTPFAHAEPFVGAIDGVEMPTYMRWISICYVPTLCFATVACIPCGRDGHGMPFGVQVIGPHRSTGRVIAAAAALEAAFAEDAALARPVPDIAWLARQPAMERPAATDREA